MSPDIIGRSLRSVNAADVGATKYLPAAHGIHEVRSSNIGEVKKAAIDGTSPIIFFFQ